MSSCGMTRSAGISQTLAKALSRTTFFKKGGTMEEINLGELRRLSDEWKWSFHHYRVRREYRYWRWFGSRVIAFQLSCPGGAVL